MMRGWGGVRRSFMQVKDLFNETFRNGLIPISKLTVKRTIKRFENTGSVKERRTGRPITATIEEKSLYILQSIVEDPHCTLRKVAQEHGISMKSVHRILKKNKFHPFKITVYMN